MTKTYQYGVSLTAGQKVALERIALHDGEAASVVIRRLIREEARRLGFWMDATPPGQAQVETHTET